MDRAIAEQHVEQLPGIAARRFAGERDTHLEQAAVHVTDVFDAPDDFGEHKGVVDCRHRHLDALLDGNRARAFLNRAGVRANVIDGL
jgi:hypothetical protein